jgi:hypothetical protein
MTTKAPMECLSVQVAPELKKALRKQAKRAGLSLSEWVRTRLELEGVDPSEMRAMLKELAKLSKRIKRSEVEAEASNAAAEAHEREMPARLAAIRAEAEREIRECPGLAEFFSGSASR